MSDTHVPTLGEFLAQPEWPIDNPAEIDRLAHVQIATILRRSALDCDREAADPVVVINGVVNNLSALRESIREARDGR